MVFKWPYSDWPSKSNQSRLPWKSTYMSWVPFNIKNCFKYFSCGPGIIFHQVLVVPRPKWHSFVGGGTACYFVLPSQNHPPFSLHCWKKNIKSTAVHYEYKLLIQVGYAKWFQTVNIWNACQCNMRGKLNLTCDFDLCIITSIKMHVMLYRAGLNVIAGKQSTPAVCSYSISILLP